MKHLINPLIQKVEESILNAKIEQEALQEAKNKWDNLQAIIDHEEETLKYLIGLKNGEGQIKVYRSLSNSSIDKKKQPRLPWLKSVIDYLKEADRLMPMTQILSILTNHKPIFISMKDKDLRKQLYYLNNIAKTKHSLGIRMDNKGKVGLTEWFDANGIINPKYLRI